MTEKVLKQFKEGDFILILLVLGLSIFGIVMVFSASYYNALSKFGNPYKYLIEDTMWVLMGWLAFAFFAFLDYHYLKKVALPLLLAGLVLLALIFSPLGLTINNATRWLDFKYFTVMPGEVIKFCLIIFVASFLSKDPSLATRFTKGILPVLLLGALCFGLIYKQPNLSTAGIVVLLILGMLFVAGLPVLWIVISFLGSLGVGALAILAPGGEYRLARVLTFLDPFKDPLGSGYQVVQSLLALGSGGVFGVGLGQSIQKTLYLPEPQNDFILSIIGEEIGLVGILLLMAAYLFLIWRCCYVALRAKDYFGMLLASGITILLTLQVIMNIAVVTASFPPTGVILPFVSSGGNAVIILLAMMGIMANISRQQIQIEA
ncbi:MAG: putative lipid II flippase FtsW [Clostridia bacterium]|nr:putative lipid II flippase FtsW [Clostridia bacterium]